MGSYEIASIMSGRESLRGFGLQTHMMLLCFLEHCAQKADFYMVGEPATNVDTGDFVDIKLFINGGASKKIIQVKKSITSNKAKEVVNALLKHHLINNDQVELWFTEYVLQNKMELLDAYDKLIEAINIPDFAEKDIKKQIGDREIIICIDSSIPHYSFDGTTIRIKDVDILDGVYKTQIEDDIAQACGVNKRSVISIIKTFLTETLIYRRHIFLDELSIETAVREEIEKKDYDYFKKIIMRRIGEDELLLKIKELIPNPFTANQKELVRDILFSFFFNKSSNSQKIEMSDVNALIIKVAKEFKYPVSIIDWSTKSIHGALAPSLIPTGDFTMGGGQ